MRKKRKVRCPVVVELDGKITKSQISAFAADEPAEISIRVRQEGWFPFRVRFDAAQTVWIVSALGVQPSTRG